MRFFSSAASSSSSSSGLKFTSKSGIKGIAFKTILVAEESTQLDSNPLISFKLSAAYKLFSYRFSDAIELRSMRCTRVYSIIEYRYLSNKYISIEDLLSCVSFFIFHATEEIPDSRSQVPDPTHTDTLLTAAPYDLV